jgi:hypothetical protein
MTVFSSAIVFASMIGVGLGSQAVAQQQQAAPAMASVPVTEVMAMLTIKPGITRADVMKVLPEEVRETALLYLDGKIDQWYSRADNKGVIFFLRAKTVEEAKEMMDGLPLHKAGYAEVEYIPVGPLAPLRLLTRPQGATDGTESH